MLNRVKFADDSLGTNEYIVPINPYSVDIPSSDSGLLKKVSLVDGYPVFFKKSDDRVYKLIWKGLRRSKYGSMVDTLKSYNEQYKFIDLGDIGNVYGVMNSYTKVFIIGVDFKIREGSAWIYDEVVLKFVRA